MRMNEKTKTFFPSRIIIIIVLCFAPLSPLAGRSSARCARAVWRAAPLPRRSALGLGLARSSSSGLVSLVRTYALARTLHLCSHSYPPRLHKSNYQISRHITHHTQVMFEFKYVAPFPMRLAQMLIARGDDERCALTDTDTHIQRAHPSNPSLPPCAS
eukprot:scaffold14916_cov128-Isochrysis_galbana.AAC.9